MRIDESRRDWRTESWWTAGTAATVAAAAEVGWTGEPVPLLLVLFTDEATAARMGVLTGVEAGEGEAVGTATAKNTQQSVRLRRN